MVTRYINTFQQHIADEDVDALADRLELLKDAFKNFELAHGKYHADLQTEDDEQASEKYFFNVQNTYIDAVKAETT